MPLSPIRVLIVEDQPNIREDTERFIQRQVGFTVVGSTGSVKEARTLISQTKPELVLLDIHLPDGTGFDVLNDLPGDFKVIFLTASEKHAIKAIKLGALDYLLKPIDEAEFIQALQKLSQHLHTSSEQINIAQRYHNHEVRNKLVLRSQDYLQVVDIESIIYCSSNAGYTTFFLSDNKKIVVSKILKDYEDILTEPYFLRPHQSYLINTNYFDRYTKEGFIHLKNGAQIPVATRRKEIVLDFLNRL